MSRRVARIRELHAFGVPVAQARFGMWPWFWLILHLLQKPALDCRWERAGLCMGDGWLAAGEQVVALCGAPEDTLADLAESGSARINMNSLAEALPQDSAWRRFSLVERPHYGGVLRADLVVSLRELMHFAVVAERDGKCLAGRTLVPR